MKALITTLVLIFSMNVQAFDVTPDQMTEEQQIQLIKVLNQLEPEMLDTILSEEALNWYIGQFTRGGAGEDVQALGAEEVTTGQVEGIGGFDDPNAPDFL